MSKLGMSITTDFYHFESYGLRKFTEILLIGQCEYFR